MIFKINNMFHVEEPYFTCILQGTKLIEGRKGNYEKYENLLNKTAIFYNGDNKQQVKIIDIHHYSTLYEYLDSEGYKNVLPGIDSYEKAIKTYHKFYTDQVIATDGGMCALIFELC